MNALNLPNSNLKIEKIKVQVRYRIGDEIEEDASCDSAYMIPAIDCVGSASRKSYHWILPSEKCWLAMDTAGGHGTNKSKLQYTNMLVEKYNIHINFQIPPPYTNVLILDVWIALQAALEQQYYLKRFNANALVNSVIQTWEEGHLDIAISNVYKRLKPVLCNIVEANNANDLVESKRGVKHKNIKVEDILRLMQQDDKNEVIDILIDDMVVEDKEDVGVTNFAELVNAQINNTFTIRQYWSDCRIFFRIGEDS